MLKFVLLNKITILFKYSNDIPLSFYFHSLLKLCAVSYDVIQRKLMYHKLKCVNATFLSLAHIFNY